MFREVRLNDALRARAQPVVLSTAFPDWCLVLPSYSTFALASSFFSVSPWLNWIIARTKVRIYIREGMAWREGSTFWNKEIINIEFLHVNLKLRLSATCI